jgi:hypothetical protein
VEAGAIDAAVQRGDLRTCGGPVGNDQTGGGVFFYSLKEEMPDWLATLVYI